MLDEKSFRELQTLCKDAGLGAMGTKAILVERLNEHYAAALTDEPIKKTREVPNREEDLVQIKQEANDYVEAEKKEINRRIRRNQDPKRFISDPAKVEKELTALNINKTRMRVDSLIGEIEDMFAGRATVSHEVEDETLHFRGGPRQIQCVTLNQSNKNIIQFAKIFISKAYVSRGSTSEYNTVGKVGGGF